MANLTITVTGTVTSTVTGLTMTGLTVTDCWADQIDLIAPQRPLSD